tara:strand:- start:7100 stop:7897 length:798 start_codon:yes stop_codon:yes gene_type:complete
MLGENEIVVPGSGRTVSELLSNLHTVNNDSLKEEKGLSTTEMLITVNGVELSALNGSETLLQDGDVVVLIPTFHGGTEEKFSVPSWEAIIGLVGQLSDKIRASGEYFDSILGIARGGLIPMRLISDLLHIRNLYTFSCEYYSDQPGERKVAPRLVVPLPSRLEGSNALIIDDIADTGSSLLLAKEHAIESGMRSVRTAVLFVKDTSIPRPDFAVETTDSWVIFPWEIYETSIALMKRGIRGEMLVAMGIPRKVVVEVDRIARTRK